MAVSKDLVWESVQCLHSEILSCFRECHDLCVSSGLFSNDLVLQVDQSAVDFRQLSLDTVTVVRRVSGQLLEAAITFFRNFGCDGAYNSAEMLRLRTQAREVATGFKAIAAWSRDLSGRFHGVQKATNEEAKEFKRRCQIAQENADRDTDRKKESYDRAATLREEAEEEEEKWRDANRALFWVPIANIVTGIGTSVSASKTAEAERLEQGAEEKLRISMRELKMRTLENEKAKLVADKATELVQVLVKLEECCDTIAAFWTVEADNLDSQGAKMKSQAVMVKLSGKMRKRVVEDNIAHWTKAKNEMDRYATAMSMVNDTFYFSTEARQAATKPFHLQNLGLTLQIPCAVDIKAITM